MSRGRDGHVLATVLFTDIVDSSRLAKELGDRRWRVLLDRHHAIVRRAIKRHHGRELDNAGDGFFASFPDQVDAIRCACQVSDDVRALGIEVRAGCHVGQAEVLGKKLGGITVHAGARVMAEAAPSEVLVSSMVKELVPASGFTFADRGVHALKGIDGRWQLFAVTGVDGTLRQARPAPQEAARLREEIKPPPLTERRSGRIGIAALALVVVVGAVLVVANRPRAITVLPNSLVQIDPNTDKVVADVPVENPDGAQIAYVPPTHEVWVLSQKDQVISVVDTRTMKVQRVGVGGGTATSGASGFGIFYALRGVWVTAGGNNLEELNPRTLAPEPGKTTKIPGSPSVLAWGDDKVWTPMTGIGRVYGINPANLNDVTKSDPAIKAWGSGIVFGERAVWVANYRGGTVDRVDPKSGAVTPIPLYTNAENAVPSRLAFGFGSIWVSDNENGIVYRIDPATNTFKVIPVGVSTSASILGSGIAAAGDSIWVTSAGNNEVVRIDPVKDTVQARIHLPYPPNGLTVGDGSVWVTVNPNAQDDVARLPGPAQQ